MAEHLAAPVVKDTPCSFTGAHSLASRRSLTPMHVVARHVTAYLNLVDSDLVGAKSAAGNFLQGPRVVIGHGGFGTAISHPLGAYRATARGGGRCFSCQTLSLGCFTASVKRCSAGDPVQVAMVGFST